MKSPFLYLDLNFYCFFFKLMRLSWPMKIWTTSIRVQMAPRRKEVAGIANVEIELKMADTLLLYFSSAKH